MLCTVGSACPIAAKSNAKATNTSTGIMSVDTKLMARNPIMVVAVINTLAPTVTPNSGGTALKKSSDKPAIARPKRFRLIPNQPRSETENARLTSRAPVSPNASRTSRYELKPVRAPMEPIRDPTKKMMKDPPKMAGSESASPTPPATSIPAMKVGSENETIEATAATRKDATRAPRGTA